MSTSRIIPQYVPEHLWPWLGSQGPQQRTIRRPAPALTVCVFIWKCVLEPFSSVLPCTGVLCISLGGVFHIFYDANGVPRALWGIACMAIGSRLLMLTPGTDPSPRLLRKECTVLLGRQSTGCVKLDPIDGLETLLYCDNVVWLLIPEVQRQSVDVGHVL